MKVMDNLEEMRRHVPEGTCAPMIAVLESLLDFIDGPVEQASFTELLSAPAYLIEEVEELAAVLSAEEVSGRRLSLADGPSGWFDIAEWLEGGQFARFVTIEGPDGGPQFLVPKYIANQASQVAESIQQTAAREA